MINSNTHCHLILFKNLQYYPPMKKGVSMTNIVVSKQIGSHFRTITEAVQAASSGDMIIIEPGIYNESITINENIELIGNNSNGQIILESHNAACLYMEAPNAKISNLIVKGVGDQNQYAVYIDQGSSRFHHCQFSSTQTAVGVMNQQTAPYFESCTFQQSEIGLVSFFHSNFSMENCTFEGHSDIGLKLSDESNPKISNTTFINNHKGLLIQENGKGSFTNCKISFNGIGVYATSQAAPILDGCTIQNNEKNILINQSLGILNNSVIAGGPLGIDISNNSSVHIFDSLLEQNTEYNISVESSSIQMKDCRLKGSNIGLHVKNGKVCQITTTSFTNHSNAVIEEGENDIVFNDCFYEPQNGHPSLENQDESNSNQQETHHQTTEELLQELNAYVGLDQVKNKIYDLIDFIEIAKARKEAGIESEATISHHSLFLGKPGTGKTTVARLLGKLYYSLGFIENNQIIEVDRKELVGEFIGQTEAKTNKILDQAAGSLLFIDEAYTLIKPATPNDFGQLALDLILKRMEDDPSFIVIAAGYPEEMQLFLESNPGLKDRFKNLFYFDDYTPEQLVLILEGMVEKEGYIVNSDALNLIKKEFIEQYRNRDRTFGNARMVRKFFEELKLKHAKRCSRLIPEEKTKEVLMTITFDDVKESLNRSTDHERKPLDINEELLHEQMTELNNLIGLENVKKEIYQMIKLIKFYQEEGIDYTGKIAPHSVYIGNPGTGKTTVARIVSKIYKALGILPVGDLIETTRPDLVAGVVGETALKTEKVLNKAMGSTLFIDEAYTLSRQPHSNDFGQEAIDTILKRMEDDREKFSVIVAGYTEEMGDFLQSNPGLHSRFKRYILFEDYTPEEMLQIAVKMAEDEGFIIADDTLLDLNKYFEDCYMTRDRFFSNGRFIRNVVEEAIKTATLRIADTRKEDRGKERVILREDLTALFSK